MKYISGPHLDVVLLSIVLSLNHDRTTFGRITYIDLSYNPSQGCVSDLAWSQTTHTFM